MVTRQEVEHAFGLDHQDEDFDNPNLGACMDCTSNPDSNTHPNQPDYDQPATIYAHLGSTSTVDQSAAVPQVGTEQASWGTRVEHTPGADLYVKDLGHGNKVITHVIWAR